MTTGLLSNDVQECNATVGGPPSTQPIELKEEWTSKVISPCR